MFVVLKCFGIRNSYKLNASRCFCLPSSAIVMSPEERLKEKAVHVAKLLHCSLGTAICLINKNPRIMSLEDDDILKSTTFCSNNMRISDTAENPKMISTSHQSLNRRLYTLKEFGCKQVRGNTIVQFDQLIKNKPKTPRNTKNLPYATESLMKILENCSLTEAADISAKLTEMHSKKLPASAIKAELNTRYLMLLFKCPKEKIQHMVKRHPPLLVQSIENMNSTLKVLVEKIGFTVTKLYYYPHLLTCQDYHIESILERIPVILGVSIQALAHKYPGLLVRSIPTLQKFEAVLTEFGITKKQLAACPKVVAFTPNMLRTRLQALCDSEDFILFKTFRGFLFLVCYYRHLHARVKLLKEANLPFSLSTLIIPNRLFKKKIILNTGHTYLKDVSEYLAEVYNCKAECVRNYLHQLPFVHYAFFADARKVIDFLLSQGISKDQLWNGLGIIACKPEVIERVFANLSQHEVPFSEWLGHPNFIQLLTHAIQKGSEDSKQPQSVVDGSEILKIEDDSYDLIKEFQVSAFDLESDLDTEIELSDSDDEESLMSDAHKL